MIDNQLSAVNEKLASAIEEKSKQKILKLYDFIEKEIDLESADNSDFAIYDDLVNSANEILLSEGK